MPGVEHRHVDVRGVRMHVAQAGDPDAPVAVLLHGWPQHWFMWRHLIADLARDHRVLAPDLRGFGWSSAPGWGYDKPSLRDDVLAALDALGVDRFRLAGHDWGGWVGFLLCLAAPERVERYVALNIAHPWQRLGTGNLSSYWRQWYMWALATPGLGTRMARGLPDLPAPVLRRIGARGWTPEDAEVFLGRLREPERARATQLLYRSFVLLDLRRALRGGHGRLTTPTLLLFGTDDQILREHHVRGANADDLQVELVPGVGHFIVDEAPDLVAERTRAHFTSST